MTTPYLQRILAGLPPGADDWADHLLAYHDRFPGLSPAVLAEFRDERGNGPYDVLARHVAALAPRTVIDVGCGDGTALARLVEYLGDRCRYIGADVSERELDLARRRCPQAELLLADAVALPIETGSLDCAVSHLVLMLLSDQPGTLRETRRVLRPGAALVFVVDDPRDGEGPRQLILSDVVATLRARFPDFDPRATLNALLLDTERREAALRAAGFCGEIETTASRYVCPLTVESAWAFVRSTYFVALLDDALLAEIYSLVAARVESELRRDGDSRLSIGLTMVTARA